MTQLPTVSGPDWVRHYCASVSDGLVTLVANTGDAKATMQLATVFPTWAGVVSVPLSMVGTADWVDVCMVDASLGEDYDFGSQPASGAGIVGVRLDLYNNKVWSNINGSLNTLVSGYVVDTASSSFETWKFAFSAGASASMTIDVSRADGATKVASALAPLPSFQSSRLLITGRTGGLSSTLKVSDPVSASALQLSGVWGWSQ